MANFNTDFLKYDAKSIKDSIIQKLSNNSDFTDQLFEGSNLTTLIDVFAYSFEVLQYYVNHGASESMFSDAQIYENLNRIVKMLGYNPNGAINPEVDISFSALSDNTGEYIYGASSTYLTMTKTLPKYTSVSTGLTDKNGEEIFYSFTQNLTIENQFSATDDTLVKMVNGKWTAYNRTFISTGLPLETFTLNLIPTSEDLIPVYVSHPYVDVYIKRSINDTYEYIPFTAVSTGTLYGTESQLYGPNDAVFELRLNESKYYEIKFGDGIHGQKLEENDEIYIIYLRGNGEEAQIGAGILNEDSDKEIGIAGYSDTLMYSFLNLSTSEILSSDNLARLIVTNVNSSSKAADIETVEEIRKNAPNFFRMGGRLVTARDYRDFILATFRNTVYDVNVMNNWEYMASFHKWLYDLNLLTTEIRELGYYYADSCDFNNVYIWTKFRGNFQSNTDNIERVLLPRKVLTSEPIVLEALDVTFVPCNQNNSYDIDDWDPDVENWIEIVKDKNSITPSEKVRENVINLIKTYFNENVLQIGQNINISQLESQILALDGVKDIYTVFRSGGFNTTNDTSYINSLQFAYYTNSIVNGADLTLTTGNINLLDFQFPVLKIDDLSQRVKVVFESFGQPTVEY